MKPVLPHKSNSIVRNDGLADQAMRAWMETATQIIESMQIIEGSGSPEGVVFAQKHKEYFNTSGAPGSYYYRKTTASNLNTGWVATG